MYVELLSMYGELWLILARELCLIHTLGMLGGELQPGNSWELWLMHALGSLLWSRGRYTPSLSDNLFTYYQVCLRRHQISLSLYAGRAAHESLCCRFAYCVYEDMKGRGLAVRGRSSLRGPF